MTLLNILVVAAFVVTSYHAEGFARPITIPQAKQQFAQAKLAIVEYYTQKDEQGLTGFEREIAEVCTQAESQFLARVVGPKDTIVFDIDETVLSNKDLAIEENFETKRGTDTNSAFRIAERCTPIAPTIKLVSKLRSVGYKIVFITSRRAWVDGYEQGTRGNMAKADIAIDETDGLFLLPESYKTQVGEWKALTRDALRTKGYVIVGSVGDSNDDLADPIKEPGVINVKLPNYLY